jgi:hypothetical protein
LDGAKTEFEPYRWGALLAFQRMDGVRRLADRAAPPAPARLCLPLSFSSAFSGKGLPLSCEIHSVQAI